MTTLPPPQDPLCVPDPATIAEAIPVVANGPVFGDSRASYGEGSPFEWTIRLSETGAAHRFVAEHKGAILFVAEWKNWYLWTGSHWKEDVEGGVYRLLWRTVELFVTEAADTLKEAEEAFALEASQDNQGRLDMAKAMGKFGHSLQQRRVQTSVLDLASHHSEVVTTFRKLNQGIWLLNTPGTTVDLRDGSTKANDPADLITACTPVPYTPDAPAPRFRQFIDEITADAQAEPRPDLADYLQRLLGLGITGSVREHILPIFHGFFGANGKGTLINCVRTAAGPDYASVAAENLVLRPDDGGDSHPTKIADLYNKRIVVSSELEESAKLAESLIKRLTGADPLKGRRMRQDPWEFEPTHKLFLLTNHRPNVIGTDGGLWRRMRLIPFDRSFHGDNADPQLPEKLQQEAEGILAWLVQGAIFYYATGERPPEVVQAATLKYREEQDDLGHFIQENCVLDEAAHVQSSKLFMAYRAWAAEQGTIKPWTQKALSTRLSDRGYEKKVSGVAIWYGIGLLAPEEPTEAGGLEGLKPNSKAKLEGSEILAPSSPHVRSRAHRDGDKGNASEPSNPPACEHGLQLPS